MQRLIVKGPSKTGKRSEVGLMSIALRKIKTTRALTRKKERISELRLPLGGRRRHRVVVVLKQETLTVGERVLRVVTALWDGI